MMVGGSMSESEPRGAAWRTRMRAIAEQMEWSTFQKGILIGKLLHAGRRLNVAGVMAVMGIRSVSAAYKAMNKAQSADPSIERDECGYWYSTDTESE